MTGRLEAALAELVDALRAEVRADAQPMAGAPDRLLSIDDAAGLLGLGRSAVYGELGAGRLRSIKVGRRRLVPGQAIAAFIAAAQSEADGVRAVSTGRKAKTISAGVVAGAVAAGPTHVRADATQRSSRGPAVNS